MYQLHASVVRAFICSCTMQLSMNHACEEQCTCLERLAAVTVLVRLLRQTIKQVEGTTKHKLGQTSGELRGATQGAR
uniref:Uncharacterized protein n=1 Tax=Oryza brachyantha TaxID=4533 RepID=J3MK40_ORYBR